MPFRLPSTQPMPVRRAFIDNPAQQQMIESTTLDVFAAKIGQLKELFPGVFTWVKIAFDCLKARINSN